MTKRARRGVGHAASAPGRASLLLLAVVVYFGSLLPAIAGVAPVAWVYLQAHRGTLANLQELILRCEDPEAQAALLEMNKELHALVVFHRRSKTVASLQEGMTEQEPGNGADARTVVSIPRLPVNAAFQLIALAVLALIPFGITSGRITEQELDLAKRAKQDGILTRVLRPVVMKFCVASVTAWGWIYVLNGRGMGASTTAAFIEDHTAVSSNTFPRLLRPEMTTVIAGFVGWYLFFTAYMFYRARRGDVRGRYVYGVVFRKLLLTLAVSLVLALDEPSVLLAFVAFLVGVTPSAAIDIVKSYLGKDLGATRGDSLGDTLNLSPWDRMRLEEEGIDSLSSLVMTPRDRLRALPVEDALVEQWCDIARLALVVGPDRYGKLRPVCMTASYFLQRHGDAAFRSLLNEIDIRDPDEIATLLTRLPRRKVLTPVPQCIGATTE